MLDFSQLPDVSALHPELTDPGELEYAAHMKAREDALHAIFGTPHPDGRILSPVDPQLFANWPGGGIYQYPQSDRLDAWHYVTSGLAQPFPDAPPPDIPEDERYSGAGCELIIAAPGEVAWAPNVLLSLVKYLLFDKNARPIYAGDRIPCGGPLLSDSDTELCHLVALFAPDYESEVRLPAGRCELIHLVGVTQAEIDMAKSEGAGSIGSSILCDVMRQLGVGTTSDPERQCLTQHADFEQTWAAAKARYTDHNGA